MLDERDYCFGLPQDLFLQQAEDPWPALPDGFSASSGI